MLYNTTIPVTLPSETSLDAAGTDSRMSSAAGAGYGWVPEAEAWCLLEAIPISPKYCS